jgi:hypothetical protein
MRRTGFLLCLLAVLLAAAPSEAVIGASDVVPAATLLFPYFEADLDSSNGVDTLIGIQNGSATAILAHVTLWTDLGVPTVAYDIYLTGYDTQTVSMRDLFASGIAPRTASAGQDPGDQISPKGAFSQDVNFASCYGFLPFSTPALNGTSLIDLQRAHQGLSSGTWLSGLCGGYDHGDRVARGYLTVDTVSNCMWSVAGVPGYFGSGGSGSATDQNTLLGDFTIVNRAEGWTETHPAVHIEASWMDPLVTTPGNATFYANLVNWTAADNREPLPTAWAATYLGGRGELLVWRDPGKRTTAGACSAWPSQYPLGQNGIVAFDGESNGTQIPLSTTPFRLAAQRVFVGEGGLDLQVKQGWVFLNLNTAIGGGSPAGLLQSWVMPIQRFDGHSTMSAAVSAVPLAYPFSSNPNPLIP